MKNFKLFILFFTTSVLLFSCKNNVNAGANSDTLAEVKIGTQIWSTKNLDVSTFRNGDSIPEAKTNEEWLKAGEEKKPAWCYYDNDPANGKKYGKLYNWYAVIDARGLAPKGWHVPTMKEWEIIIDSFGGYINAGTKMKSDSGWYDYKGKAGNGTNESGFAGSPGGERDGDNGYFKGIGHFGYWWDVFRHTDLHPWFLHLNCYSGVADSYGGTDLMYSGFSVRCLRD